MRQVIGQLQEEEKKASRRAKKLAEELKGEYFMARVITEVTSSFNASFWCLQNTIEETKA